MNKCPFEFVLIDSDTGEKQKVSEPSAETVIDESKVSILFEHDTDEIEPETGEKRTLLEIIEAFGDEEINAIMVAAQIKCEIKFEDDPRNRNPYILFQYIKGFISALCTIDPTKVHYDIVRETIKRVDERLLNDTGLIDMMARKLIEFCKNLNARLQPPKTFQDLLKNSKRTEEEVLELILVELHLHLKFLNLIAVPCSNQNSSTMACSYGIKPS